MILNIHKLRHNIRCHVSHIRDVLTEIRNNTTIFNPPEMGKPLDDKSEWVVKRRVRRRFNKVAKQLGVYTPHIPFRQLFNLPAEIPLKTWMYLALRGRGVDSLLLLTLGHIVPLSQARNLDELIKLMSWKNTRFLDKDLNQEKNNKIDDEARLLCLTLLGRLPDGDDPIEVNKFELKLKDMEAKINNYKYFMRGS